jgi:signal transduction histidine kinase
MSRNSTRAYQVDWFAPSTAVRRNVGDVHRAVELSPRFGFEAIRNAYQHSSATVLDIELRYSQELTLRVRDNGVGIDPAIADQGRDGHFGLQGMRERAARIGGTLTMMTSGSGTEVKLSVPGGIIFQTSRSIRKALLARMRTLLGDRPPPSPR